MRSTFYPGSSAVFFTKLINLQIEFIWMYLFKLKYIPLNYISKAKYNSEIELNYFHENGFILNRFPLFFISSSIF